MRLCAAKHTHGLAAIGLFVLDVVGIFGNSHRYVDATSQDGSIPLIRLQLDAPSAISIKVMAKLTPCPLASIQSPFSSTNRHSNSGLIAANTPVEVSEKERIDSYAICVYIYVICVNR